MAEFVGPVLDHLRAFEDQDITTQPAHADLGVFKNPYSGLAAGMEKLGEGLTRQAERQAGPEGEVAGAKMVTRDANGNIQIQNTGMMPIGPAGQIYREHMKMGALAEADGQFRREEIAARDKFRNDPEGYNNWATNYQKGVEEQFTKAGFPDIGIAAHKAIDNAATQTYKGLLSEKDRLDLARTSENIKAGLESASDDALAMARGGADKDDPHLNQAIDKYTTLLKSRADNPRMAYSQDEMNLDLEKFNSNIAGQRFLYHIDQEYKDNGANEQAAVKAEKLAESIRSDPDLKMNPAARDAYYHKAMGEIRANEGIRKQNLDEVRAGASELRAASEEGAQIEPSRVDEIANAYRKYGDPGGAATFLGTMSRKPLNDAFGQQSIPAMTDQINGLKGTGGDQAAPLIRQFEGFRTNAYWDVNHWRTGFGSDTVTRADGTIEPVTATTTVTREDAERDLARRIGQSQDQISKAIGADAFGKLTPGAKAALTSVTYNYGHLPSQLIAAAQSGDTAQIAEAVRSLPSNPGRRQQEAASILGHFTPSGPAGTTELQPNYQLPETGSNPAASQWLIHNRQKSLDTALKERWKQVENDWKKDGVDPDTKTVDEIVQGARAADNGALLDEIGAKMQVIKDAAAEAQKPLGQQATDIGRAQALAAAEPGAGVIAKELQGRLDAIKKGLNENPIQTTINNFRGKVGAPDPLDFNDPNKLIVGLQQRAKIAQFAGQNWGVAPPAALDSAEIMQLKGALANASPMEKAGIYGALGEALPENVRNATLRKLGGSQPMQLAETAAGGMMKAAPEISASIFNGLNILGTKDGKKFDPEADGKDKFRADIRDKLPPSALGQNFRDGPTSPYATLTQMVKARYADLAYPKGDETYNRDRLKQAVDDVTGGVLSFNGGSVIAPQRGMSQTTFDGVMASITDADMQGVATAGGQPVTANTLRSRGALEAAGPGRYFVRIGEDQRGPVYAYRGGSKFSLDLSQRQAAPAAQQPIPDMTMPGVN